MSNQSFHASLFSFAFSPFALLAGLQLAVVSVEIPANAASLADAPVKFTVSRDLTDSGRVHFGMRTLEDVNQVIRSSLPILTREIHVAQGRLLRGTTGNSLILRITGIETHSGKVYMGNCLARDEIAAGAGMIFLDSCAFISAEGGSEVLTRNHLGQVEYHPSLASRSNARRS